MKISESTHKKIFTLITHLIRNPIHGVVNIHPGYSSILLTLDKMANIDDTIRVVENILDVVQNSEPPEGKLVEVPVLYGGNYGKDIQRVVQFSKLSEDEIIQRHQSGNYLVYFLGFSPGFPYLGGMDQEFKNAANTNAAKTCSSRICSNCRRTNGYIPIPFARRLEFNWPNTT